MEVYENSVPVALRLKDCLSYTSFACSIFTDMIDILNNRKQGKFMEHFVITEATINNHTTFDGSEILVDIELIAEFTTRRCLHIRYAGTLLHFNPNFIFEDRDYLLAKINQKIPCNERNTWLRDSEDLMVIITSSNHTLEREKIKNLFKME